MIRLKIIAKVIKRITFALALLFSYNLLVSSFNLGVSINPFSITAISTLGVPGLISMVILKLVIK